MHMNQRKRTIWISRWVVSFIITGVRLRCQSEGITEPLPDSERAITAGAARAWPAIPPPGHTRSLEPHI
jgi:hypothetical protein